MTDRTRTDRGIYRQPFIQIDNPKHEETDRRMDRQATEVWRDRQK